MRVVAGKWRGTKLSAPAGDAVRPTTDRVKEALFAMLHFDLPGASVLDLFGGSGALGIEAASRGASRVAIVEPNAQARRIIAANLGRIGDPEEIKVLVGSYQKACRELCGVVFNIILMDPPYAAGLYVPALHCIREYGLADGRTIVVLESDGPVDLEGIDGFAVQKEKHYGSICLTVGRFL